MKEPRLLLLTKYSVVLIRVRPFGDEEAVPGAEAVMPSHTKTGMVTSHSRLLMTLHPISVLFGLHGSAMISKTLRIPKP